MAIGDITTEQIKHILGIVHAWKFLDRDGFERNPLDQSVVYPVREYGRRFLARRRIASRGTRHTIIMESAQEMLQCENLSEKKETVSTTSTAWQTTVAEREKRTLKVLHRVLLSDSVHLNSHSSGQKGARKSPTMSASRRSVTNQSA